MYKFFSYLYFLKALLLHSLTCVSTLCTFDKKGYIENKCFKDMVSYGIGSLLNSKTARYQFSLLLLLKEKLQVFNLIFIILLQLYIFGIFCKCNFYNN